MGEEKARCGVDFAHDLDAGLVGVDRTGPATTTVRGRMCRFCGHIVFDHFAQMFDGEENQ